MELVKDGRLSSIIKEKFKKNGKFTDNEASALMRGILSAVCYMHENNIVHRDLKPGIPILFKLKLNVENILV
jgi:serine/threonine protein kinase